jgi:hypothetical protein
MRLPFVSILEPVVLLHSRRLGLDPSLRQILALDDARGRRRLIDIDLMLVFSVVTDKVVPMLEGSKHVVLSVSHSGSFLDKQRDSSKTHHV